MARRSLPLFPRQDLEDGDPTIYYYNSPMKSFTLEPSLRLKHRVHPFEQFVLQGGGFSYPVSHGFGRGQNVPGRRTGRFREMFEYEDGYVVGDGVGYYSPYGCERYHDNRIPLNGAVNRRLSSVPDYLLTDRHSVMELREYTNEERLKINRNLERLCDKTNSMMNTSGPCESCGTMTTRYCQRCNAWYCSRDCQLGDWPRHKMQCISIPELGDLSEELVSSAKEQTLQMKLKLSQKHEKIDEDDGHNSTSKYNHPKMYEEQNGFDNIEHTAKSNHRVMQKFEKQNGSESRYHPGKSNYKSPRKYGGQNETDSRQYSANSNQSFSQNHDVQVGNNSGKTNKFNGNRQKHNYNKSNGPFVKENYKKKNGHVALHQNNSDGDKKEASRPSREEKFNEEDWNYEVSSSVSTEVKRTAGDGVCEHGNPTSRKSPAVFTKPETSFTKYFKEEETEITSNPDVKSETAFTKRESSFMKDFKEEETETAPNKAENLLVSSSSNEIIQLPKDTFTKVKVTVPLSGMQCWVQLEDSEKLLEIMSVLNEETGASPLTKVERGMLCAALYEGLWFRGKVTLVEPELRVLYIDYGNEECCALEQLKPMPAAVKNLPALALKIKLAEGTSKTYEVLSEDKILSVKCVDVSGDTVTVQVEGELYPKKKNETPVEKSCTLGKPKELHDYAKSNDCVTLKYAFLNMKVGKKAGCEFQQDFGKDTYGVTIVCPELRDKFTKLFTTLNALKDEARSDDYKPCVGETVVVFEEGGSADGTGAWMRAHVLAIDDHGYQVNLFDHSRVATVDIVCRLPRELVSIPEFGARCYILDKLQPQVKESILKQKRFFFTISDVDLQQKKVICVLHSEGNQTLCKAELTEWVPVLEEKIDSKRGTLKNNDKVVLSVFFNLNALCLRHSSQDDEKMLLKLEANLSRHCSSAPDVTDIPAKNEIVACKFLADGKYYRAQILNVEKDQIKVLYIDYGNLDCVMKSSLKLLTPDLKKISAFVFKVSLKNLINGQVTKETIDLLTTLTQNAIEMKVVMTGLLEEGIELILPDGKKLTEEINKTLAIKKLPEKQTNENILTEKDIKYLELPVEKTVDFIVLHKMDSESIMGCEASGEIMTQVHGIMSEKMNKYCESTSEKLYIPKVSELCFAKYEDGMWYRAMCIGEDSTRENNILFLDFGNMAAVDYSNIRKMTPDFVELPAVAVLCSVQVPVGMTAEAEAYKKKLDELVNVNRIYEAHIVSCDGPGSYVIEFPQITEALKKLEK